MPYTTSTANGHSTPSKSFQITADDGAPIEIQPGEYYFNTKARCRRMMQNSLSSYARQVYACLELATMGWKQELAIIMDGGQKRPLTPTDISNQTDLDRQDVRLALAELEDAGLAERRPDEEGGTLRKGHVLIYSWATPKEPKCKEDCSTRNLQSSLQFPDWFPESWEALKPLIKRLKLNISIDESSCARLLSEGEEVARAYKEAEIVVARFLERVCARPKNERINKEDRKERYKEKEHTPPTPSQPPEPVAEDVSGVCVEEDLKTPPKTNGTEPSFGQKHVEQTERVRQAFERCKSEYKRNVLPDEWPVFRDQVRTDADIEILFACLEIYNNTAEVADRGMAMGFGRYMRSGAWRTPWKSPPAKAKTANLTKPDDDVIERFYAKRRKNSGY